MNYETIWKDRYTFIPSEQVEERLEHSKNVVAIAKKLNQFHHLGMNEEWIEQAGYLHDYAKYIPDEEYEKIARLHGKEKLLLSTPKPIWHAYLGPYFIEAEVGRLNTTVMEAIRFHTTGKKMMDNLQELILLSDFIEEGRSFIEAKTIREIAFIDYKKAIAMVLKNKIEEVTNKKQMVHSNTLEAFQDYEIHLHPAKEKLLNIIQLTDHNLITDIKIYDTTIYSPFFDAVVVATALSARQMEATINYIANDYPLKGLERGDFWILIDLSDVIFHLFLEDARQEYGLDRLYGDLPILKVQ